MAGYSGTPLAKKLGLKEGPDMPLLLGAPRGSRRCSIRPDEVDVHQRAATARST